MVEMSIAQRRAIAMAKARQAAANASQASQPQVADTNSMDLPVPGVNGGYDPRYQPLDRGRPAQAPVDDSVLAKVGRGLNAAQSGAMQGMTFGLNDEIQAGLRTPFLMARDAVQGQGVDPGRAFNEGLDHYRKIDEQLAQSNPNEATVGNIVGAVGNGLSLSRAGLSLMKGAAPTVGSMATRGAAEGAAYAAAHGFGSGTDMNDRINQAVSGAGWGAGAGGFLGALGGAIASKSAAGKVPTVESLKAEAGALYDKARANGAVAPQPATQALNQTMKGIATNEGLITPTGRVNSSYPRIAETLKTFDDFSNGTMDVAQAQAVRKVLSDAAKSNEPGERRIATIMLDQFDQFLDPLAPEISVANQIYSRAKKGEAIQTAIELARSRAGQFSGSGFENALRTEFRGLDRQIIKGQLKGLTQPEIDAIRRVANGGPVENILRFVGKAAPTGVVSMGAGFGVPFAVGNAVGGPGVGAAAGAVTMGTGLAARQAATAMQAGNARNAIVQALMAGQAPVKANPAIAPTVQALIAGQGVEAPKINPAIARALAGY
ncbi:hypothetical protein PSQ19_05995 [Devosia algicola]|uniref:Tail length tape measure protein n=1 Tax=Devosia algicola TaxID=3026418 RepID=A0ABY7YQT7_9HYPH|nr:hypothetical protein [Devosia algicola]WDR03619.1 hypothetical protein PSQ19_05995 [Devosia algicola]